MEAAGISHYLNSQCGSLCCREHRTPSRLGKATSTGIRNEVPPETGGLLLPQDEEKPLSPQWDPSVMSQVEPAENHYT